MEKLLCFKFLRRVFEETTALRDIILVLLNAQKCLGWNIGYIVRI